MKIPEMSSSSKRKAGQEEEDKDKLPDPDGPWARNKQFHPTPSSYADYRKHLLEAASAAFGPVGGPPLAKSETRGPMEQFAIYVELRDPKPLLELIRGYPFKDYQLEILLAQSLHANLLEVVGQLLDRAPALLNENLVEYAVRTPQVGLLAVKFLLTLLAEKNSTTVEQTAQLALKRLGQDQLILNETKIAKLRELAREGPEADQRELKRAANQQLADPEEAPEPVFRHEINDREFSCVRFTPDSRYLAVSDFGREIKMFDWRANRLEKTLDFSIGRDSVSRFTFSPDGQTVYAACHDKGRIMACRMDEQAADRKLEVKDWGYPYHMAVSHDGKLLAVGCEGSRLIVVDTAKWSLVKQIKLPVYNAVTSVCFSLDDRQLFTSIDDDTKVYAFDTQTWVQRSLLQGRRNIGSMVCHPTKPLLVGVSRYTTRMLWYYNYETGESGDTVFEEFGLIRCKLRFTGYGRYVVAAGSEGETVILDTENDWKSIRDVDTETASRHMDASASILGIVATCGRLTLCVYDIGGLARAQDSLGSAVSSGLANWGQPQSAWDAFLSYRLRDPRLFLFVNQFLTGSRHCY